MIHNESFDVLLRIESVFFRREQYGSTVTQLFYKSRREAPTVSSESKVNHLHNEARGETMTVMRTQFNIDFIPH